MIRFSTQHTSMQFSDSEPAMAEDLHKIFAHAQKRANKVDGRFFGTGTEAGSNPLHHLIPDIAPRYGFHAFVSGPGEWGYVDKRFGHVRNHGYIHVLDGHKTDRTHFGYNPRGITFMSVVPHEQRLASVLTFGVSHLITGTYASSSHYAPFVKKQNSILLAHIGAFAYLKAQGSALCFYAMDANADDAHRDVFMGAPLTTCWDALKKYPPTHDLHGSTIDVVAKADIDGRVRFTRAVSLTDKDIATHDDHNIVDVDMSAKPIR